MEGFGISVDRMGAVLREHEFLAQAYPLISRPSLHHPQYSCRRLADFWRAPIKDESLITCLLVLYLRVKPRSRPVVLDSTSFARCMRLQSLC